MQGAQFSVDLVENRRHSGGYFELVCRSTEPNPASLASAGQFVMLRGDWGRDLINGRAFSVFRTLDERTFSVLAKVFGRGTALLAAMGPGARLTCTGPFGSGFPSLEEGERQLLVAGGVGMPPLHLHARRAAAEGKGAQLTFLYGGRGAEDLVCVDELVDAGIEVVLATEDGSRGHRGFVTEPLASALADASKANTRVLSCGPTPMLKAVRNMGLEAGVPTMLCLEEQMACGFGVCLGCAVPVYGPKPYKYCCSDGPVFDAKEIRWA